MIRDVVLPFTPRTWQVPLIECDKPRIGCGSCAG
jgi:hypothetical protein